jgi:thioredoxin 1
VNPKIRWAVIGLVVVAVIAGILVKSRKADSPPPAATVQSGECCPGSDTAACCQNGIACATPEEMAAAGAEGYVPKALPRMLELGSVGCKPCDMMAPIIEELKKDYAGKLSVEFYDVRKDPAPGREHGIRVIPTQIFIGGDGKEMFRHEGFLPKEEILPILAQMGVK